MKTSNMYTALSDVYDLFGENDEKSRADYYCRFIPRGDGIDIGCGTGALTLELLRRGYNVYGVDSSEGMLCKASEKALSAGISAKFILGDAADPPATRKLDFAVAANDVYNYVPKLDKPFEKVYGVLKGGGVFAFDISTGYKLNNILAGNTFSETKDGITYIWQNFKKGNKLIIDFTVFYPQGETYIKTCETQVQYVHNSEDVTAALQNAGFKKVTAYAFGGAAKPKEKTERIVFIAKK